MHNYASPGLYQTCLVVCNGNSCDTLCKEVDLLTPKTHPVSDWVYSKNPISVEFTDLSTNRDWVSWDFGHASVGLNYSSLPNPTHSFPDTGLYQVCQVACVPLECDTICKAIYVSETLAIPVQAGFTHKEVATRFIAFRDASISTDIQSYFWDFGDPMSGSDNTSTSQNPNHYYANTGIYQVCLIVCSPNRCDTFCTEVLIADAIEADFTYSINQNSVHFSDASQSFELTTWYWDFGDGTTSDAQNPNHIYSTDGVYEVCLIACNTWLCDTICQFVAIGENTIMGQFSYTNLGGNTVQFYDESIGLGVDFWSWIPVGVGGLFSEQNPIISFPDTGYYYVCLNVCAPYGCDFVCDSIYVTQPVFPINANFSYENTSDYEVTFTDDSQSDSTTSWLWTFGDGNTSNEQNPNHTYVQSGTYTVCLIACTPTHCDTICQNINIENVPIFPITANFSYANTSDYEVTFTDESQSDSTISWIWTFGDGQSSTAQNPSHQYSGAGTYMVCLIACTPTHCDTICQEVILEEIIPPFFANFGFIITNNQEVAFTDQSMSNPISWAWDFGDGTTSTAQSPQHIYTQTGTFTACLVACNALGICDTYCLDVVVETVDLDENTSKVEENLYTIFPNPVQQEVYIYPKHKQNTSNVMFSLYDITGRAVFSEKLSKNQAFWKINLGSLVEGLYFYAIKDVGGVVLQTGKVVKQR